MRTWGRPALAALSTVITLALIWALAHEVGLIRLTATRPGNGVSDGAESLVASPALLVSLSAFGVLLFGSLLVIPGRRGFLGGFARGVVVALSGPVVYVYVQLAINVWPFELRDLPSLVIGSVVGELWWMVLLGPVWTGAIAAGFTWLFVRDPAVLVKLAE